MAYRQKSPKLQLPKNFHPKIGIVQAIFNKKITDQQCAAACTCLEKYNIKYDIIKVPGCFEIPYTLQQMARTRHTKYHGLVAIGCLIKGRTRHFEVIARAVSQAIMDLSIKHNLPIGFGIITAESAPQARTRINLGYEATYAVLATLINVSGLTPLSFWPSTFRGNGKGKGKGK